MHRSILAIALVGALPALAQTSNDDMPAIENWWDEVGADFFGEATLQEPRPEYEIRAQWTGLSADDQAAVRARCATMAGAGEGAPVASTQEGSEDNAPDTTAVEKADGAETGLVVPETGGAGLPQDDETTTGSVNGQEVQEASPSNEPAEYTGLAGRVDEDTPLVLICDLIKEL